MREDRTRAQEFRVSGGYTAGCTETHGVVLADARLTWGCRAMRVARATPRRTADRYLRAICPTFATAARPPRKVEIFVMIGCQLLVTFCR